MASSESDYTPNRDQSESSLEIQFRTNSRRASYIPSSPRKRGRSIQSKSPEHILVRKYHLEGHYNDDYRKLFNHDVSSAAERFEGDISLRPHKLQIGASKWSSKEKMLFFAALERLGRDNTYDLARAVGTKTIPEVKEFLNILEDASKERDTGGSKLTLRDVPAAIEVGEECAQRLDLAGDALAWYQEKFEAKQEQERFGKYWLITPEIAEQVGEVLHPSRQSSHSSMPPATEEDPVKQSSNLADITSPAILQAIPEAKLLDVSMFLELSSSVFMNSAPDIPRSPPHWESLLSPLASKPSIYRTALMDFHTLVISLTQRLTQASIIQATSRLRSQGWRSTKGVKPFVRRRDVLTAIDMLRLQRNGKSRWKGVARRCHLRVLVGRRAEPKEVSWDDVEAMMNPTEQESAASGAEGTGSDSGEESTDFKRRAIRGGTPRPHFQIQSENDTTDEYSEESSNEQDTEFDAPLSPSREQRLSSKTPSKSPEQQLQTVEEFDQEASRQEESRLWEIIGDIPATNRSTACDVENDAEGSDIKLEPSDWRGWTTYRAEWETLKTPVPAATFKANEKSPSPNPILHSHMENSLEFGIDTDGDEDSPRRSKRQKRPTGAEIQIQNVHSYALAQASYLDPGSGISEDDAKFPTQSIEYDNLHMSDHRYSSDYDME